MDPIELELQKKYGTGVDPIQAQLESKYNKPMVPTTTLKTTPQREPDFIDKVGEFGSQAGRSIWRTLGEVSSFGEKMLQAPMKLFGAKFDDETAAEKLLPKELIRKGETKTEKSGEVFGQLIQYLTPVGAETAVAKGTTILGKLLARAPKWIQGAGKLAVKSTVGGAEFAGKTALMGEDEEEVKTAGLIGLATPPAIKLLGTAGKFAFKDLFPAIAGSMTGIDPKTIKAIFSNPEAVAKYISQKVVPLDVRRQAIDALSRYRSNVVKTFQKGLDKMAKLSPRIKQARTAAGENFPGVFSGVKNEFKRIMSTGTENLKSTLNQFRVSIQGDKLNFDKLNSSIISPTERKQIQAVWDTIRNQKDFSVRGVQDVAARINALAKFTDGPATRSSAIIGKMLNVYKKAIKKVYPDLSKLRKEYEVSQQILKGLEDIIKSGKDQVANPTTATNVSKKLIKLFNEDNEAYVRALRKLEQETGEDLINQFIAANFDALMPASMGSRIAQAGLLAGGIAYNPMILAVLPLFSPNVVGRTAVGIGKASQFANKLKPLLPNILK